MSDIQYIANIFQGRFLTQEQFNALDEEMKQPWAELPQKSVSIPLKKGVKGGEVDNGQLKLLHTKK